MATPAEKEEYIMDQIIHFSPYIGGNASEYIMPRGNIDITSHGMGSGIYGLSRSYLETHPAQDLDTSNQYIFSINLAFTIHTEEECNNYINSSKNLLRDLQQLSEEEKKDPDMIISEESMLPIAMKFVNTMNIFDLGNVSSALWDFWKDYKQRQDIVAMPINYILVKEGFDGVMSDPKVSCHSWGKGDVKFIPYPTYQVDDVMPVACLMGRKGVDKPVIDLAKYRYTQDKFTGVWKKVDLVPCRHCGERGHFPFRCPNRKK